MASARAFSETDIDALRRLYLDTLSFAAQLYGPLVFRPYKTETNEWAARAHKAFYDAVMIGLSSVLDHKQELLAKRESVIESTKQLFQENEPGTFTGRGNTKADIKDRIQKYEAMIRRII